jgi:tubulin epsilon
MKGPLADLFDASQLLTDVSGSGNNWAHGFSVYGPRYHDALMEQFRSALEPCDSPQSFFLLHSLGGGTGSGLGSYVLQTLEDEYPEIYRFTVSVFPSAVDDVITSPYNSVLALSKLTEHADCVLPIENQALIDMCGKALEGQKRSSASGRATGGDGLVGSAITELPHLPSPASKRGAAAPAAPAASRSTAFDAMNNVVAHMVCTDDALRRELLSNCSLVL